MQNNTNVYFRLHPMKEQERHQLGHLAELYSLDMHLSQDSTKGLTCPVLTKTRYVFAVSHEELCLIETFHLSHRM